jgi:hypothetical protein
LHLMQRFMIVLVRQINVPSTTRAQLRLRPPRVAQPRRDDFLPGPCRRRPESERAHLVQHSFKSADPLRASRTAHRATSRTTVDAYDFTLRGHHGVGQIISFEAAANVTRRAIE